MSRAALDQALAAYRRRRRIWLLARGLAVSAAAALALTLALVQIARTLGFDLAAVRALGATFYAGVAALCVALIAGPLRRETARQSASVLEAALPALEGRVATYVERAGDAGGLVDLLAEDTLARLQAYTPERLLPRSRLGLAAGAGVAALALLVVLGARAPGARRLWTLGIGAALPQLRVEPGDAVVQRGAELTVRARAEAFEPSGVRIEVRFEGASAPESAQLQPDGPDAFVLRFAAVDRPFTYTVSAGRIASGPHRVRVLDPPRVEALRLRYVYPDWAHREPRVVDGGEDIAALEGTRVELELTTDAPLEAGALVIDGEERPLALDGRSARGALEVERSGTYHVAARLQGRPVRLTRDFAIEVLADAPPTLEIAKPARDRSATAIEEVTVGVRARDDVHLESLALRYSINGGAWREQRLPTRGAESDAAHVFALEAIEPGPLVPGDVIAYYAQVRDRGQSAQTDLYFLEVRPFDRSYTQSQQRGGGAAGGEGPGDISARQRQILVATWNLVHAPADSAVRGPADPEERAALVARLQQTLLAQTRGLVERLQARGMGAGAGPKGFVDDLKRAAGFMESAAAELGARSLADAIEPEQRALQSLLRAEASLRELQLSMQADGTGGGNEATELEELIGLELDPTKNQYEIGSRERTSARDPAEQEELRKLEDLAQRQRALTDEMRRTPQPTLAQRWRQETLRRELEELRRSLGARASSELSRQLDAALREMDQAQASDGAPRQAQAALDGLERALREAREERRSRAEADLAELARRARELARAQQESAERLQATVESGSQGSDDDSMFAEPSQAELALAQEQRELQDEVNALRRETAALAERMGEGDPEAARRLSEAAGELERAEVAESLARSADLIRRGAAAFASGDDTDVRRALERFSAALRALEGRARSETARAEGARPELALGRLAEQRRRLERAGARAPADADPRARWSPAPAWNALDPAAVREALREASRTATELARGLEAAGGRTPALRALGAEGGGADRELAQRRVDALAELDQLELELRRQSETPRLATAADPLPSGVEAPDVADYFRRLSRDASELDRN